MKRDAKQNPQVGDTAASRCTLWRVSAITCHLGTDDPAYIKLTSAKGRVKTVVMYEWLLLKEHAAGDVP